MQLELIASMPAGLGSEIAISSLRPSPPFPSPSPPSPPSSSSLPSSSMLESCPDPTGHQPTPPVCEDMKCLCEAKEEASCSSRRCDRAYQSFESTPRREASESEPIWRQILQNVEESGDETINIKIRQLRSLLGSAQVPSGLLEDGFLKACLRAKKYNPPKAAELLLAYEGCRTTCGWVRSSPSAAALQPEIASGFNTLLPYPDVYGHTVVTQTMQRMDLSIPGASVERYQKIGYYLLHRALRQETAQVKGIALLIDFGGFSFSKFIRRIRLSDLRRGIHMMQDCAPAHLECIYLANTPVWIGRLLSMIRSFLRKDTLNKKLIFLDKDGLRPHFDRQQLPVELGGQLDVGWSGQLQEWLSEEALIDNLDISRFISDGASATQKKRQSSRSFE